MKKISAHNQYSDRKNQSFVFQSSFKSFGALARLLRKMKRKLDLPCQTYSSIWVSVNEAISNAIIHGNKFDLNKKVRLLIQFKKHNLICFTITDEGSGFDFENVPTPTQTEHETKAYGRGVSFMKKLADSIVFSKKGTEVDLYFKMNGIKFT